MKINLKEYTKEDDVFLYNLMSNTKVRKYFANPKSFSYKEHTIWIKDFKGKISIIWNKNKRIGMIRELNGEITIALLPEQQGKGIGKSMLKQYCKDRKGLTAEINPNNIASIRAYTSAGFRLKHLFYTK